MWELWPQWGRNLQCWAGKTCSSLRLCQDEGDTEDIEGGTIMCWTTHQARLLQNNLLEIERNELRDFIILLEFLT